MSDTHNNQWVPVSERLPEVRHSKLVYTPGRGKDIAYRCEQNRWWIGGIGELRNVTHWMDLPEPPAKPKPVDPFEEWWHQSPSFDNDYEIARAAWNAAKEHYAKPLPDFETWWNRQKKYAPNGDWRVAKDGYAVRNTCAQAIWNAAQGKPEV